MPVDTLVAEARDAVVPEARERCSRRRYQVAPVEQEITSGDTPEGNEVHLGELRPLGCDDDCVRIRAGFDQSRADDQAGFLRNVPNGRVVGDHIQTALDEASRESDRRRLAGIGRAGLEGEAEEGDAAPARQDSLDGLCEARELARVLFDRGPEDDEVVTGSFGDNLERPRVLGKTRPAPAQARTKEVPPDPWVQRHRAEYRRCVRADGVRDIRNLVHEAELRREEAVRGVLGQLRAPGAHPEQRSRSVLARATWQISPFNDLSVEFFDRALRLGRPSGDDSVGEESVVQCLTLTQELRIRHNAQAPKNAVLETVARPYRNRGPDNDHSAVRSQRPDLSRRGVKLGEVRPAVLVHRRAYRDDDDLG